MPVTISTSKDPAEMLPPGNGVMSRADLDQAKQAFQDRVTVGGVAQINGSAPHFPYGALELLVGVIPGPHRIVAIHLGLLGTRICYGFSFRAATLNGTELHFDEIQGPTHIIDHYSNFKVICTADWAPLQAAYRNQIHLDRGDGHGSRPITPNDAYVVTFPWESEIVEMYRQTTNSTNGPFRIELSNVCLAHGTADGGPAGYRHGVSLHVQRKKTIGGWTEMVNDTEHSITIYHNKGVDHGNLCPPRCRTFKR
jgi:hypothetical protein